MDSVFSPAQLSREQVNLAEHLPDEFLIWFRREIQLHDYRLCGWMGAFGFLSTTLLVTSLIDLRLPAFVLIPFLVSTYFLLRDYSFPKRLHDRCKNGKCNVPIGNWSGGDVSNLLSRYRFETEDGREVKVPPEANPYDLILLIDDPNAAKFQANVIGRQLVQPLRHFRIMSSDRLSRSSIKFSNEVQRPIPFSN